MGKAERTAKPAREATPAAHAARLDRWHWLLVPALLTLTAVLAVTSLVGDSVTFDETAHLAAGMSYLKTGDFRLSPEHPPLSKLWTAWPLLFVPQHWPAPDDENWVSINLFGFGRRWLFELNDGQRLIVIGRCMMVVLLLATCLTTYALARRLFGSKAGLLTLVLAALSPSLLAHGRLVTTDLPITLCTALTLLTFARLMERVTWPRLIAAALALTAATLTKFSWPLVLPALLVMAAVAILGRRPIELAHSAVWQRSGSTPRARGTAGSGENPAKDAAGRDSVPARAGRPLTGDRPVKGRDAGSTGASSTGALPGAGRVLLRPRERALAALGAALFTALVVWVGIWTCYRWRLPLIPGPPSDAPASAKEEYQRAVGRVAFDWQRTLNNADGTPRRAVLPTLLNAAAANGLFPDAYLLGLAVTLESTAPRPAYLFGQFSDTGWRMYFPLAFAIKTPLATLLFLVAGIVALVLGRTRSRDAVLLAGLIVFVVIYAGYSISSRLNIGHRHLLPVYPVVFVLAGASAAWLTARRGRWLVGAALVWLLGANLWIYPHYLSYFNELTGGPSRGHLYLADSNIDWGQDLLRLAAYARRHPGEPIKLGYFGSAIPTRYLDCTALPSHYEFEPRAELNAGTYVVSLTRLLGVYDKEVRDSFWTDERRHAYQVLGQIAAAPPAADDSPEKKTQRAEAAREYRELRYKRLYNRLQHRAPDEQIGYSLFVYRQLTDADVEQLTAP